MDDSGGGKLRSRVLGIGEQTKKLPIFVLFGLVLFFVLAGFFSKKAWAANAPAIITYQGKLLVGNRLATTTQNMSFILYDASSGGNILYTASGTIAVPQALSTTPVQGLFSINLGDSGTNALPQSIFQNNNSIYLEVRIDTNILTPRKRITAAPYAFNAKYLDGVGINTLSSTTYIPVSDASGNFLFNSTTITTSTITNLISSFATTTNFFATSSILVSASSTNLYVSGVLGLPANSVTDVMIPDTITASNYLLLTGGILSGALTFVSASGTALTSTFALFVSATTTDLAVTGALSLPNNSVTDAMVVDTITASNYLPLAGGTLTAPLFFSSASGTAITSTSAIFISATTTNLYVSGVASIASGTITYLNSQNVTTSILSFTSATGTNLALARLTPLAGDGGALVIGSAQGTGAITVGNSTASQTLNLGTGTSSTVNIATGLGTTTIFIGTGGVTGTISIGALTVATRINGGLEVAGQGITTTALYVSGPVNFGGALTFNTASGTALTSTNFFFTTATGTSITSTNLFVSGPANFAGAFTFNTASGTMITSTDLYVSNKIGVNTSSPIASLAVQGFDSVNPLVILSSTNAQLFAVKSDGQVVIGPNSLAQTGQLTIETPTTNDIALSFTNGVNYTFQLGRVAGTSGQAYIGGPAGTALNLRAGGIDRINIASASGNVGINTSTAQAKLTVVGTAGSSPIFDVASSSNVSAFIVLANGNVGINTSSPLSRLTVVGFDGFSMVDVVSSSGVSAFKILANGNVGIGTSTPTQRLSVSGNISNVIDSNTVISQISTTSVGNSARSVYISGRYAYVGNTGYISVVDVSNPSAPIQIATTSVSVSGATAVSVAGRYLYAASIGSSGNFSVIDISNPSAPVRVGTTSVGTNPNYIFVSGRYAYTANLAGGGTISVVDISNPLGPVQIVTSSVPNIVSLFVSGRYLYAASAGSSGNFSVIDISNPSVLAQISTTSVGGSPKSVYVSGRYAYVTNGDDKSISVVDVSNPSAPVQISTTSVGNIPQSIFVSGRYAYVANYGSSTISVVDVSNPLSPIQVATTSVDTNPYSIFVSGRYAYTASVTSGTISVVDISGTEVSSLIAHSAEVGNLQSRNDIFAQGNIMAGTSLTVGAGGIMSQGSLSVFASSTGSTSSIFSISSPQASNAFKILANGSVGINTSSPVSIFSVVGTSTFAGNVLPNSSPTAGASSKVITTVDIGRDTGKYTSIAIGTDGFPVISYHDDTTDDLIVAKCGNASCSSGNVTTTVDSLDNRGQYSSIAIGTDGFPVISYYDSTSFDLIVAKCGNASCSSGNVTTTVDNTGDRGDYTSIAIGTDGFPVISYHNITNNALMVVKCGNASCTSGNTIYTIDSGNNVGQYNSIAIGTDGFPVISYYDATATSLKVVKLNNSSDYLTGKIVTTVDNNGVDRGDYSSIAIGTDGLPVISYRNNTDSDLMVAKCTDSSCSAGTTISTVDSSNAGKYSSIAIGADGFPVIIYQESVANDLMVVKCGNASCSSGNATPSQIDFAGNTGLYTSIAIGADGFPVISYNYFGDGTNGDLVVAKCADSGCVNTTGTSFSGVNIGSLGSFFNNVYANSFWGKQFQIEGFDLAESYRVDDLTITAGDLVRIATSSSGVRPTVEKTSSAYDGAIGVISTNPGIRLSDWTSSPDGRLVALVGRVPTKVSVENGSILAGDLIAASSLPGIGMKATKDGATVGRALESYSGNGIGIIEVYINPSWAPGQSPLAIDATNSTITVGSSSNPYDLVVTGNIILNQSNLINKLSFATSTLFESSVENFVGARAFTFNAINFNAPLADNYILSLRANNNSVFSVAANGDVHAVGNYYGASAVLGTSTNPGDLAERVDIAIDDTVEAGDVMMVDRNAPDTYRRSGSAYEQSVAGVISTNPTIVVGNGRTDYTSVLAMVGRVPIKVSDENGAIARGDLLVSASRLGYAMKYDPTKDKNNKVVGIIGMALESLPPSSSGKILALIRTGWVYNRDEDIKKLKNNIEQVAMSQGISLDVENNPGNLSVLNNNNNQLVYSGGNLNLQNNSLINVASIVGNNNKWRIDEFGNLVQKITTASGDKEIYGLQSSIQREIVISGTSTLENGSKRVTLTDLDQAVIDKTVPLKIMVTPSGETNGVYVTERTFDSFLVKENENGQSNAEFDWTVIAKVLNPEPSVSPEENNQEMLGNGPPPEQPIPEVLPTSSPPDNIVDNPDQAPVVPDPVAPIEELTIVPAEELTIVPEQPAQEPPLQNPVPPGG